MANGDQLRQLFSSYMSRDDSGFIDVASAIIRDEELKNHRLLADDLGRIIRNGRRNGNSPHTYGKTEIPKDRERGFPLFTISEYDYTWDRLIVRASTRSILNGIAEEYQQQDLLVRSGIGPTKRVMFFGPPGCGKTMASRVLASVMSAPLITVRFDAVVSSLLGETAANLRRVFDFIERGRWVVLFDEFDAIAKDRDNPFEHGELKRVVNSLLQLMDAYTGESLLIAATNHESMLDNAVWRRFEELVEFPLPSLQDRTLLFRVFLRHTQSEKMDIGRMAKMTVGASGADIERMVLRAYRRTLISGRRTITNDDMVIAVDNYIGRYKMLKRVGEADPKGEESMDITT